MGRVSYFLEFLIPNAMKRLSVIAAILLVGCRGSSPTEPVTATHPEGVVATTLALSGRPHGVTIAPNGTFCVSQIDGNSVTCGTLTATTVQLGPVIPVGLTPAHVALDPSGKVAYTANQTGNSASIIDVDAAQVVATVPLGDGGFNVTASRRRAYVTTAGGQVFIIDAQNRQAITNLPVGAAANGLALDTLASALYVSSRDAGTVTVINTSSNVVTRCIPVGTGALRVALSPDRKTLYVASEQSGAEIVNLSTGAVSSIPGVATGAVGLALSPDGGRLYIANPPGGLVQIVDPSSRTVLSTLTGLGRPRNVAFGASGATALVTDEDGRIIVIR